MPTLLLGKLCDGIDDDSGLGNILARFRFGDFLSQSGILLIEADIPLY